MKIKLIKNQRGYTLVETLVAISIFSVSILAILAALSQSLVDNSFAKRKATAAYLAQEGIEYMRNLRDTYVIYASSSQTGWDNFKSRLTQAPASCGGANGCYFNAGSLNYSDSTQPILDIAINACSGSCPSLLYANGVYGYTSGSDSGFRRKIKITQISANELKITSTVSWPHSSGTQDVTFTDNLFNWIE